MNMHTISDLLPVLAFVQISSLLSSGDYRLVLLFHGCLLNARELLLVVFPSSKYRTMTLVDLSGSSDGTFCVCV